MAHDNNITGEYMGRGEPYKIYHILNDFDYSNINFEPLKENVRNYFKTIKRDLDWIKETTGEWEIKSRVKPKEDEKFD